MNILLVQLRRIGDVVCSTPAVRAVRMAWPDAQIDFLTEPPSNEVFEDNPDINNIITIQRKMPIKCFIDTVKLLRSKKYDVVIDFFCNTTSAYLVWLSGAKLRIGYDLRYRKYFYTNTVNYIKTPRTYTGLHKLCLTSCIGAFPAARGNYGRFDPEFPISAEKQKTADELLASMGVKEGDRLVTMAPIARHSHRNWPAEHYAKLADALIEQRDVKVLFICGPGEEKQTEEVRSLMKYKSLEGFKPQRLWLVRGLCTRSLLHIGNDAGLAHVARSAAIPNITIFAYEPADLWTPPENPRHLFLQREIECKATCLRNNCTHFSCIKDIQVDEVLSHALKFIDGA